MRNRINKSVIWILPALLMAVCLTGCSSETAVEEEPDLTVEAIVAKYLEAVGGVEAHQKLRTRRIEGTMIAPGTSEPFPITIIQKAPDKKHTRVVHPELGEAIEGVDGRDAWGTSAFRGFQKHSGDILKDKLADARFHAFTEMVTGGQLSYEKREKIGKHDCHVIKATYPDNSPWSGKTVHIYIDAEEYLLRRTSSPAEFGGNKPDVVVTMDHLDYKRIDGIQFPHGGAAEFASGGSVNLTFHKVTHGVDVDDSLFDSPSD